MEQMVLINQQQQMVLVLFCNVKIGATGGLYKNGQNGSHGAHATDGTSGTHGEDGTSAQNYVAFLEGTPENLIFVTNNQKFEFSLSKNQLLEILVKGGDGGDGGKGGE
jgi:hypothetical protein